MRLTAIAFGPASLPSMGWLQRVKVRALAEVQRELFADDDLQAMQPTGPCIAKSK